MHLIVRQLSSKFAIYADIICVIYITFCIVGV